MQSREKIMNAANTGIGMKAIGEDDWTPLPGFDGLTQVVLSGRLDEQAKTGRRTRLVRFAPGVSTQGTLVHDYYEEVYLVEGVLSPATQVAGDVAGEVAPAAAPAFVFRPPGTPHGPFLSEGGCVLLEVHYYA